MCSLLEAMVVVVVCLSDKKCYILILDCVEIVTFIALKLPINDLFLFYVLCGS